MPLRAILLLIFCVGSIPICFLRPFYGILLWIVIAFLNPQSNTWGFAESFPWAMAIAIPTLAGMLVFSKGWQGLKSRNVLLLAILWGWFTVTTVVSTATPLFQHHASDTWDLWIFVSKVLLMTFAAIVVVDGLDRLRRIVIVIAGCFGFFVAKAFPFIISSGGSSRVYGPENSMIADNNDLGLALNMTLPLFFFLAQGESRPWLKRMWGGLFLITIPSIFFTYSRGALVGLVVVFICLVMFLPLRQRALLVPVIAGAVLLVILFAPVSWKQRMDPTSETAIDGSAMGRLQAWTFAWNLASDYPIAGGGFGTFTRSLFQIYAPGAHPRGPHSVYFQLLAEHGFVGVILYLTLVASCFATLHRLRKQARRRGDLTVQRYANMFQFSLIGFLSSGAFLGRAYFDYYFTIVACVAILQRAAVDEWRREDMEEMDEAVEDGLAGSYPGDDLILEGASR